MVSIERFEVGNYFFMAINQFGALDIIVENIEWKIVN